MLWEQLQGKTNGYKLYSTYTHALSQTIKVSDIDLTTRILNAVNVVKQRDDPSEDQFASFPKQETDCSSFS